MAKNTTVKGTVKVVPKSKIKKAIRPSSGLMTEKVIIAVKKKQDGTSNTKKEG